MHKTFNTVKLVFKIAMHACKKKHLFIMTPSTADTSFAFDIGHSSIGWAAFEDIHLRGCGVITFAESCQNQKRASNRRMRRHIAATKNRIERLRKLLLAKGVASSEIDGPFGDGSDGKTHPTINAWPWHDAARVLEDTKTTLSWAELWNVLRWYAHNRGYDGNARWSRNDTTNDTSDGTESDAEKAERAKGLMVKYGTYTMSETVCAALECSGNRSSKRASRLYFKGYGAAFPREIVVNEVRKILEAHKGKLLGVDDDFINGVIGTNAVIGGADEDWKFAVKDISPVPFHLPQRFKGSLLFGQYVPRFDNRIIPPCRITGKNTPSKHSEAFYRFRWMQTLGNVVVRDAGADASRQLAPAEIAAIDAQMKTIGRMTQTEFKGVVCNATNGADTRQLEGMFLTEEMEEGLVLDPALATILNDPAWAAVWGKLSDAHRKIWRSWLFHEKRHSSGRAMNLQDWFAWLEKRSVEVAPLVEAVKDVLAGENTKSKTKAISVENALKKPFKLKSKFTAAGRAPYCSEVLHRAADEYASRKNPKRAPDLDKLGNPVNGTAGATYEGPEALSKFAARPLAELTNNHLVRHRLVILEQLLENLVKEYAGNDASRVGKVIVEVIRDLKEFSGLSDKAKAQLLGQKLGHHRRVSKDLEAALRELGLDARMSAGLIRKARIADDQGWKCPYTGADFGMQELLTEGMLDLDHIIPRSLRPSDSLDSLVLTFSEVNGLKKNRTAWRFIQDEAGKSISVGGAKGNKMIMTPAQFENFVKRMKVPPKKERFKDDYRRCKRRKDLLLKKDYNERVSDFLPKDLTQTSHLNKLAAARIKTFFSKSKKPPTVIHLPGSATGSVRKSWKTLGCIGAVVPAAKDANKTDIRGITHLHHAVDAATLGWIGTFLNRGQGNALWEAMLKRNATGTDAALLRDNGNFSQSKDGKWELIDLPNALKNELIECLGKLRVRQHIPATRHGLKVEETVWRVNGPEGKDPLGEKVSLTQKARPLQIEHDEQGRPIVSKMVRKNDAVKPAKLLGYDPALGGAVGKLGAQKGARIIAENYGVAFYPGNSDFAPQVIPFFKVHPKLREIAEANGGKWPSVLRNGMVIEVKKGTFEGKWIIRSVKDNASGIALDMSAVDCNEKYEKGKPNPRLKINVSLSSLLKSNLNIIKSGV